MERTGAIDSLSGALPRRWVLPLMSFVATVALPVVIGVPVLKGVAEMTDVRLASVASAEQSPVLEVVEASPAEISAIRRALMPKIVVTEPLIVSAG